MCTRELCLLWKRWSPGIKTFLMSKTKGGTPRRGNSSLLKEQEALSQKENVCPDTSVTASAVFEKSEPVTQGRVTQVTLVAVQLASRGLRICHLKQSRSCEGTSRTPGRPHKKRLRGLSHDFPLPTRFGGLCTKKPGSSDRGRVTVKCGSSRPGIRETARKG